jgi:hypothetical protein
LNTLSSRVVAGVDMLGAVAAVLVVSVLARD